MAVENEGATPEVDPFTSEPQDLGEALAAAFADEQAAPETTEPTNGEVKPTTYTLSDGTEVPLEELEKGYLRQADYTKKTQSLAEQRAEAAQALALMEALVDNPAATLEALRQNLLAEDNENLLDPMEAKLQEYDQRFQTIEQQEFERELDGVCSNLEAQYPDFDREIVLQYAVDNEIPNLRAAYLDWRETTQSEQQRAEHNAQALQAKRNAPPVAGRGTQLGGAVPEFREVNTLADAMANALLELQSNGSI